MTTNKHNESGIALLYALSILSLLLVMALAFATNSIFDQKMAFNTANTSSAKLLAMSEVNKAVTMLTYYGDLKCSNDTVTQTSDMLSNMTTVEGNTNIFKIFEWQSAYSSHIRWEYFTVSDGVNNRLIGRAVYVILPIYALNANQLTKAGVNEATYSEERIGVDANELNVQSISPSDIGPICDKFNWTGTSGGVFTGNWLDYVTMFSLLGIGNNFTLQNKLKNWLIIDNNSSGEYFWRDINADGIIDTAPTNELFNRFNLPYYTDTNANGVFDAGTDTNKWDALGNAYPPVDMYEKIILDKTPVDGTPDQVPTIWTSAPATNDGYGIPWLAFFGYDKDGVLQDAANRATFPDVIARRRQIAANLVDYCDSNNIPTSNVDPANWGTTAPAFTGNERTPYINEIGFEINAAIEISKDNPAYTSVKIDFNYRVIGELINIYESSYTPSVTLQLSKVSVDLVVTCGSQPPTAKNFTVTLSPIEIVFNSADWHDGYALGYSGAEVTTAPAPYNIDLYPPNHNDYITNIKVTKVNFESAILSNATKTTAYDYANVIKIPLTGFAPVANNSVAINFNTVTTAGAPITKTTHVTFEAKDPRQNLNADDWDSVIKDEKMNANEVMTLTADPYGKVNNHSNPSTPYTLTSPLPAGMDPGFDLETVSNPACTATTHMSTAYIRNAPILSPWELGFIHRGQAWQTINLKAYDKDKAIKYIAGLMPGGELYASGDANILDQIKMTTNNYCSYKKINSNNTYIDPNTEKNIILQTLFDKIIIGSAPATPGLLGAGAVITNLDTLVNAVSTRPSNLNYVTRAEVANALSSGSTKVLSDGTCGSQTTDATQEELIGKFINLTDVSGSAEYFYIIAIAQTIKDVGGATITKMKGAIPISKATSYGTFDYDAANDLYFDEIIAEQKIKALIYRDPTGKCTVLRYEYVE